MALTFRYRFVNFGTKFSAAEGTRGEDQGSVSPSALYANELVTDVGGSCCNGDEPLVIIDHHFSRENQFPSASAAVLHKAKYLRERFAGTKDGVFWLVTHIQPDFDAFCSMYLARRILEHDKAFIDWEGCGLHPDGWQDLADRRKIHWFAPDLHSICEDQRWPLLMASYASIVDNGKQFACPRSRALHSVLYAALKRGRDYLSETSGAQELFDAITVGIRDKKRNPLFDSVLEDSTEFAPELEMLDREIEAYRRDVRRARKAIINLQRTPEEFPTFFAKRNKTPLLDSNGAINLEHLVGGDERVATDGIYLRDPECLLFKEWARLDLDNSSMGRGFEFTAIAYSGGRPDGKLNTSDYFFAIDPERANGRHLYSAWARLQAKEVAALQQHDDLAPNAAARPSFEERAGTLGKYFADPWFDGQNYFGTIVATPNDGTMIGPAGMDAQLSDDVIVEMVRSEVEHSIYRSEGVDGACLTLRDLSARAGEPDLPEFSHNVGDLQNIQAPVGRRFRFARIPLREGVSISVAGKSGLAEQIGETLWQVLYPDLQGSKPHDFAERHLVVAPQCVGVWGDRGIAVAYRAKPELTDSKDKKTGLEQSFGDIVELARGIDQLIKDGDSLALREQKHPSPGSHEETPGGVSGIEKIAADGEAIARLAAKIKHNLTLPESELLRRFYEASGIDELLNTLRDLNQTAAEQIRRQRMEEQARKTGESTETVAEVQSKLEFLEVFIVGVYALEMFEMFTKFINGEPATKAHIIIYGGLFFLLLTAALLVPWRKRVWRERPLWILLVAVVVYVAAIIWGSHVGFVEPSEGPAQHAPVPHVEGK